MGEARRNGMVQREERWMAAGTGTGSKRRRRMVRNAEWIRTQEERVAGTGGDGRGAGIVRNGATGGTLGCGRYRKGKR
jgi:hypothetical protein